MQELMIKNDEGPAGWFTLRLIGRLDTETVKMLDRYFESLKLSAIHHLYLDLAELDYISSLGLREVFKMHKYVVSHGGKVAVGHLKPHVRKVLNLANALPSFSIFESTAEADAYFDKFQQPGTDPSSG